MTLPDACRIADSPALATRRQRNAAAYVLGSHGLYAAMRHVRMFTGIAATPSATPGKSKAKRQAAPAPAQLLLYPHHERAARLFGVIPPGRAELVVWQRVPPPTPGGGNADHPEITSPVKTLWRADDPLTWRANASPPNNPLPNNPATDDRP